LPSTPQEHLFCLLTPKLWPAFVNPVRHTRKHFLPRVLYGSQKRSEGVPSREFLEIFEFSSTTLEVPRSYELTDRAARTCVKRKAKIAAQVETTISRSKPPQKVAGIDRAACFNLG